MKGFTLLEILAVVAIMATLVVVIVPQLTSFNKSQALDQGANQLQTALRTVQNNAQTGVVCTNNTDRASGWHLQFVDNSSYIIEPSCPAPTPVPTTVSLPANVVIQSIMVDTCTANTNSSIQFSNVVGIVDFVNTGCNIVANSKMIISLQLGTDTSRSVKVIMDKGGSVYVSST